MTRFKSDEDPENKNTPFVKTPIYDELVQAMGDPWDGFKQPEPSETVTADEPDPPKKKGK